MNDELNTKRHNFLPDLCRADTVLYITLMTQLLAIILAITSSYYSGDFWASLSFNALFILWVAFSSAAILCFSKNRINHWKPPSVSLFSFLIINLCTFILTYLTHSLLPTLGFLAAPIIGQVNPYLENLTISGIISLVILRYLYIQYQWKKQNQAQAEAKLDALQARIRPHFLFNSLNTIASLTRENPLLAETLTEDLAELFRANMQSSVRLHPFKKEHELTQQYLNIEQTRLGQRLQLTWDVSGIPDDTLIPPLSLQPLVENAVYHGIEPSPEIGELNITGRLQKNIVSITIKNSLYPEFSTAERKGNKMALENIRLRLQNCFPDQAGLMMSAADGYFQTVLWFPYQK